MQPLWAKHKTSNHQHHLDRSVQIEFLSNREWYERDKWSWNGVKSRIKHISRSRCFFFSSTPFALFIYFSSLFISYLYVYLSLCLWVCISVYHDICNLFQFGTINLQRNEFITFSLCFTPFSVSLHPFSRSIIWPALLSFPLHSHSRLLYFCFRFDLFASHGTNFTMSTEY